MSKLKIPPGPPASRFILSVAFAATLAISLTATPVSGAHSGAAPGGPRSAAACGWGAVSGAGLPSLDGRGSFIAGVAAVSENHIWIVGQSNGRRDRAERYIARRDGGRWKVYAPARADKDQGLAAIAAASSRDIWVVGGDGAAYMGEAGSLIDHWDGGGWARVRHLPAPPSDYLSAAGVMPVNHHLWAAGEIYAGYGGNFQGYVVHWNGHRWVGSVPPRSPSDNYALSGIAPISPTDVLVLGDYGYAARWDGKRWTTLSNPVGAGAITAVSKTEVWAVGGRIARWNGAAWKVFPLTLPPGWYLDLASVSAVNAHNVWAVGQMGRFNSASREVAEELLVAHWNGTEWTRDPTLTVHAAISQLTGVSTLPNGDAWAVGYYGKSFTAKLHPLIERYTAC